MFPLWIDIVFVAVFSLAISFRPIASASTADDVREVEETNVVEPARSRACAGSDPSRSAARGLYHGAVPQVPPTERRRRLLRAVERHSGALAAAALAIVTAIGTLRYHAVHAGDPGHLSVVVLGVLLTAGSAATAVLSRRARVREPAAVTLALVAVVLVLVAPSAAWSVVPLVVLLQTTVRVVPATLASGAAIVAAAASVPRLTGSQDPGLVAGCLLAGLVFLAAIVLSRSALRERSTSVRQLVATRARLVDSERRASALGERQHVAAGLHDTVLQSVAGVLLLTEAAERSGDDGLARDARRALRSAVAQTRTLVDDLGSGSDDEVDLASDSAEAAARVGAGWSTTGEPQPLSPLRALALLRTAQGALGNAERHADATTITLELRYGADSVVIVVSDDGVGFDVEAEVVAGPDGGHGLAIMRRRLAAVGGALDVRSDDHGTVLTATVPVAER